MSTESTGQARLTALLNVMTDHERAMLLAYIAGRAPGVLNEALAAVPSLDAAELAGRLAEEDGDLEPYCTGCGGAIGHFIGHGDGWHHFRGNGTVESPNELYDAGHAPVVAWREAVAAGA